MENFKDHGRKQQWVFVFGHRVKAEWKWRLGATMAQIHHHRLKALGAPSMFVRCMKGKGS